jgi:hypothetical protein
MAALSMRHHAQLKEGMRVPRWAGPEEWGVTYKAGAQEVSATEDFPTAQTYRWVYAGPEGTRCTACFSSCTHFSVALELFPA